MEQKRIVGVVFMVPYGAYNAGEQAGFPLPVARDLLRVDEKTGRAICELQKGQKGLGGLMDSAPKIVVDPAIEAAAMEERQYKIKKLVGIIETLDADNERYWTEAGEPDCTALSNLFGDAVTEDERNEAWHTVIVKRDEANAERRAKAKR